MATVDNLRNSIIEKLLSISNKEYLAALYSLVEKSAVNNDVIKLTEAQKSILQLSKTDIENNKFISQEDLDKEDLK